jgi:hypothetical protein
MFFGLLEVFIFIAGIVFGYILSSKYNKEKVLKIGLVSGFILGFVLGIIQEAGALNYFVLILAIVISIQIALGVFIGGFLKEKLKK